MKDKISFVFGHFDNEIDHGWFEQKYWPYQGWNKPQVDKLQLIGKILFF